ARSGVHWLIVAHRTRVNRLSGIASCAEYSERVLGHPPRVGGVGISMRERGSVLLILRTFRPGAWCCRTWSARRHGGEAREISNVLQAQRAHEELLNVALTRAKLDRHETHWLIVAYRTQANRLLGIASFAEYSERVLGPHPSRHRRTPARSSRSPRLARTRPGSRNRDTLLDRS